MNQKLNVYAKPRELYYDIESSPNLGYYYGGKYKTNIIKIDKFAAMFSFSWAWGDELDAYGKPIVRHASIVSVARKKGTSGSKALAKLLHSLIDEAHIVYAHNGDRFDNKFANTEFAKHSLGAPSPYKSVDTLKVARRYFLYPGGNSLQEICNFYNIKGKAAVGIKDLWYDCIIKNDHKAWKLLEIYNNDDVTALWEVNERQRPFNASHPNLADIAQVDGRCPSCLSTVRPYQWAPRRTGKIRVFICNEDMGKKCGRRCNPNTMKQANDINARMVAHK